MKLGFGFYRHMLNDRDIAFARQCGATHAVVHLVDYFNAGDPEQGLEANHQPVQGEDGYWGISGDPDTLWDLKLFLEIKERLQRQGISWYAIENIDPSHWYDVLLGGPRRDEQLEGICRMIRDMGKAGIPVLGYNFSLAGVTGRVEGAYARGGAVSVGMEGEVSNRPLDDGVIWNMKLPNGLGKGSSVHTQIDEDTLWERLAYFLNRVLPVAEESGVRLALHPDDPPVERLRNTPRLVRTKALYQKVVSLNPSSANAFEYCLGTLSEMPGGHLMDATEQYAADQRIAYVHFRNVIGQVPNYREVFVDEGEIDMARILDILHRNGFEGVLIPDHTPQMSCDASWHAGMAYAMGYMKALLKSFCDEEGLRQ